jgi:hypothetical protein
MLRSSPVTPYSGSFRWTRSHQWDSLPPPHHGQNGKPDVNPTSPFAAFLAKFALIAWAMLLLASLVQASRAQPYLSGGGAWDLAWPGLGQDDLDRMNAASARLYEGRSIGTVERWLNPDTRDAGEVKLIRSFDSHGMPCRTLDYIIRFQTNRNRLDHYVVNWCRVSGNDWKVVELAPHR